ncbi:hypothetical protein AX17_003496 [Amanita inopinata Kibby_2008]|nr:hypothetical protein AX17_003496 [Amanita inopinata Kibby_2008]
MDTFAFAALAHVRILLVPVGPIPQPVFERHASEIRSFETIRLGDIPANAKDERARFMPNPLSAGHLLLSFPTHPPPHAHHPLALFRPSHFPLAVIGVAVCSQRESLTSIYSQFDDSLIDVFPPGSVFPLAKSCFVYVGSDEGPDVDLTDNLPGLVVIPNVMGNKKLYIGTLLADLCSNILGEFAMVVQTLESPIGNEYLNSSLLPLLPPQSELPSRIDTTNTGNSAIPSHHSHPELSRNSIILSSPPPAKRNSSGSAFRQSTLNVPAPKKRMSTIGVASSHGRLFKVLGDLFLLAGRVEDASVWYTEALQLLKNSQDVAWHASTLEGMATISVVEAWTAGHGLHNSTSSSREPWADISEKLSQAANLYQKSAITEGEHNYALLSYIYTSCILRHASLFFSIWSAKSWGPLAFTTMLQPGPRPYLPPTLTHGESAAWANLERLSTLSGVTRSFISSIIAQAHGPWLLHLGLRERIGVLEAMASLYACLGYRRKEAYVLREVLGCIMDLVVCGREEDGLSRPTNIPSNNGLGIQGTGPLIPAGEGAVGIRFGESSEGNDSILQLLKHICKVLGVNLEAVKLMETDEETLMNVPHVELEDFENSEPHGWPELQVGVVREAVAVAEALPDFPAVAQFSLSSLKGLRTILTPTDQLHLYSTSARAISIAKRRGDTKCVEYWSGKPVINIAITPAHLTHVPVEKPMSALQPRIPDVNPILTGVADPFLYNPRKAVVGESKILVVQNEVMEFTVTLHNPFVFDLEIQSISISATGVEFDSQPSRVIIPGNSLHQIVLSGRPLATGTLSIRGCHVQAPGGASREFTLPLITVQEEGRLARRKSALACEMGRYKYSGLESFPCAKSRKQARMLPHASNQMSHFLECKVVPEQPLLRIRRTSITHGAVMLYDGEKLPIRITIENISRFPIDFIRLAFDDNTIGLAQQSLVDGELSVFDTYETEYDLIHRSFLSWNKDETINIPPGQSHTLTILCCGKVGCTKGIIHISYAYAHRPESEVTDVFHARQLSYSMMVTVYQMLDCHGMDVLPLPSYPPLDGNSTHETNFLRVDGWGWCLFSIDVRNTYGSPFEVTLERVQDGVEFASTTTLVPPGATMRLVIPLKKFLVSSHQTSTPIPTLSDRQFVVAKSNLSTSEEQLQREFFWYREELFKIVKARWRESGGPRSGELSLRKQRMTLPMLQTIRMESVHVQVALATSSGRNEEGEHYPKPNEFICLKTVVQNLSTSPNVFSMDLKLEPSEHVLYQGILENIPVGRLEPNESREIDTGICFLTYGHFQVLAEVRSAGAHGDGKTGVASLKVNLSRL